MASNVMPWQALAARTGARVMPIAGSGDQPTPTTDDVVAALEASGTDLRLVALPQLHWCDGTLLDLPRIAEVCRRLSERHHRRVLLVLDLTQSLGAVPLDLGAVQPDAAAASVHKWLCGPYGHSLLYISPHWQGEWTGLEEHERNRLG